MDMTSPEYLERAQEQMLMYRDADLTVPLLVVVAAVAALHLLLRHFNRPEEWSEYFVILQKGLPDGSRTWGNLMARCVNGKWEYRRRSEAEEQAHFDFWQGW